MHVREGRRGEAGEVGSYGVQKVDKLMVNSYLGLRHSGHDEAGEVSFILFNF